MDRCSHSASYICGLCCQFLNRRPQPWSVSTSDKLSFPSWKGRLGTDGAESKRPYEEHATEPSSKRRESGRLTFIEGSFRPLKILDDAGGYPVTSLVDSRKGITSNAPCLDEEARSASEASLQESEVPGPRDSQSSETRDDDPSFEQDLPTGSGIKSSFSDALKSLVRASSLKFLPPSDRRKKRTLGSLLRSGSLPPTTVLKPIRSPSPGSLASPPVGQDKRVAGEDANVPPLPKKRAETMAVQERKRYFIDTPTPLMIKALKK